MQGIATILVSPGDLRIPLLDCDDRVLDAISGKLLQCLLIGLLGFFLGLMKPLQQNMYLHGENTAGDRCPSSDSRNSSPPLLM
ncbi:hypothetical protein AWENTII_005665 [Aspergillus wentii]